MAAGAAPRAGPEEPGIQEQLGRGAALPICNKRPSHSRKESEGQKPVLPPPWGWPGLPGPLCLLPPLLPTWRGGEGKDPGARRSGHC